MPAAVVKMLLAKGANPALSGDGETAPMLAAKRGNTEAARLLGVAVQEPERLGAVPALEGNGGERSITNAVKPALALLEKQSYNFIRIGGCNSCHSQDLPSAAAAARARRRASCAQADPSNCEQMQPGTPERLMDLPALGVHKRGRCRGLGLVRLGHESRSEEITTPTLPRTISSALQTPEGNWFTSGESQTTDEFRPVSGRGAVGLCAQSMGRQQRRWIPLTRLPGPPLGLKQQNPKTTQDRAFHLLGARLVS